ncbi:MAG: hypothetical protein IPK39_24095 [Sulfuritalea sp.]|nr:hypothetical protein [Sulfuritalea sp.]
MDVADSCRQRHEVSHKSTTWLYRIAHNAGGSTAFCARGWLAEFEVDVGDGEPLIAPGARKRTAGAPAGARATGGQRLLAAIEVLPVPQRGSLPGGGRGWP